MTTLSFAQSGAVLTVDLAALRANWRLLANKVAPAECAAVVKANAYGIGLEQAVAALSAEGAKTFFVARADEGIRARATAPDAVIYILDGFEPSKGALFAAHALRPVLGSLHEIQTWAAFCNTSNAPPAAVHIDTGMNRLGLSLDEIGAAIPALNAVNAALVMSHFTSSDTLEAPANAMQIARFAEARKRLSGLKGNPKFSLANSSGIFLSDYPWLDLVRPGYALYGGNPTPSRPNPMRAVVSLHAPILRTRTIAAGETVGYDQQWTAKTETRLAVVPVGYADGIPRGAMGTDKKPGPDAAIGGQRCPIVGRISMDLITIDTTDVSADLENPATVVELLGPAIGIDEFGDRAGTIGYEILTSLGPRYRRVYAG